MAIEKFNISNATIWSAAHALVDQLGELAPTVAANVAKDPTMDAENVRAWEQVQLAVYELIEIEYPQQKHAIN